MAGVLSDSRRPMAVCCHAGDMHSSRVCTVSVDGADGYHKLMCRATGGAWACGLTSTQPPRVRCKWGPVSGSTQPSLCACHGAVAPTLGLQHDESGRPHGRFVC